MNEFARTGHTLTSRGRPSSCAGGGAGPVSLDAQMQDVQQGLQPITVQHSINGAISPPALCRWDLPDDGDFSIQSPLKTYRYALLSVWRAAF